MARLQPEQEKLLALLVEASRSLVAGQKEPLVVFPGETGGVLHRPGFRDGATDISLDDLAVLEHYDLVLETGRSGSIRRVVVTPEGFQYHAGVQGENPADQVESRLLSYLASKEFQKRHPAAYDHWARAFRALGSGDTDEQYTEIGHHCRLAMQEFADSLLVLHGVQDAPADKTKTVDRLRAVFRPRRPFASETALAVLDALVVYWGTVSDLAQRQEHGAQKEGEQLLWRDAQRLVFQTGVVMFEICHETSAAGLHDK